jgi:hypothetical protein
MRQRPNSATRPAPHSSTTPVFQVVIPLITVLLLVLLAGVAAPAVTADTSRQAADELLSRLRASTRADLAARAELARAEIGEGILVHSYPGMEPLYYLHPLVADGEAFGVVSMDARTAGWCWYTLGYPAARFPVVGPEAALARADEPSRGAESAPGLGAPIAVRAPDKRIYWLVEQGSTDPPSHALIDFDDPAKPMLSTLDGSLERQFASVSSPPRPSAPPDWMPPQSAKALLVRPAVYNIPDVPHRFQETSWYCGPACTQMLLDHCGEEVSQVDISDVENDISGYGTFTDDNRRAGHFSGMSVSAQNPALQGYSQRGLGYASNEAYLYTDPYEELKSQIARGVPVQICTCYDGGCTEGHFRVVKGYDDPLDEFIVHDPWYSSPFYGPDVHFNQDFLHSIWEPWSSCWAMMTAPWTVGVAMPDEVSPGAPFSVVATIYYPGEGFFQGQYPASSASAEIALPPGLSLVSGSVAVPLPTMWSGDSVQVSWSVLAGASPGDQVVGVSAKGIINGSSGSYPSYSDSIGGRGRADVWIGTRPDVWSPAERVTTGPAASNLAFPSARALYAQPNGVMHAVWSDTRDGNSEIYYARYSGAWEAPVRLTQHTGFSTAPAIDGTTAGVLHVVWSDLREGNADVYYMTWDGVFWSAETRLSTHANPDVSPTVADDGAGNVYAVWVNVGSLTTRTQFTKWNGTSWSAPVSVGQTGTQSAWSPSIAADALGRIHLVYEQAGPSRTPSEVHYKVYSGSWSTPTALSADPAYSRCPSIAAGSDGRLHVVWHDGRGSDAEVYYRTHDGVSWGLETRLTDHDGDSQRASITTDADGNPYVAWEDYRDGNAEIYFRYWSLGAWSDEERVTRESDPSSMPCIAVDASRRCTVIWDQMVAGKTDVSFSRREAVIVSSPEPGAPSARSLIQAVWPVPSASGGTVEFAVPAQAPVLLDVFDLQGRRVKTLVRESMAAGTYRVQWNGRDERARPVAAGVYYYRLRVGDRTESRSQVVVAR